MTVIICESTRDIPTADVWGVHMAQGDTPEMYEDGYRRHFGCAPVKAWQWGNFLYIELPTK